MDFFSPYDRHELAHLRCFPSWFIHVRKGALTPIPKVFLIMWMFLNWGIPQGHDHSFHLKKCWFWPPGHDPQGASSLAPSAKSDQGNDPRVHPEHCVLTKQPALGGGCKTCTRPGEHTKSNGKLPFIVDFPMKNGWIFPFQNVSSPEGKTNPIIKDALDGAWLSIGLNHMGLSENRVYSQWNSHLIGIMIINQLGLGVHYFQTHPYLEIQHALIGSNFIFLVSRSPVGFCCHPRCAESNSMCLMNHPTWGI